MTMTPGLRKFVLTAHITAAVGWLGTIAAFFALAIAGLTNQDDQMVRGAYLAMGLMAWYVVLPFCLVSLLTGLIQSLGTRWGLFRHYWVLTKLVINALSTIILLIHMQPIGNLASIAAESTLYNGDYLQLRIKVVTASASALLALLVATMLSVYKPKGLTPYGERTDHEHGKQKLRTVSES